jgi:hypothetical protein
MMRISPSLPRWVALFVLTFGPAALRADGDNKAPTETAAEKIRKALDQVKDLEIDNKPLDEAVNQLREQTGVNFVIDRANVPPGHFAGAGLDAFPLNYAGQQVRILAHGTPLRVALRKALRQNNLAFAVVGDEVLITTPEKAIERVVRQPTSVSVNGQPLAKALDQLAAATGANIVFDPKAANKEGQTTVSLRLDEVPLETAVELLADGAGLKTVRRDNVLFVTTEAKADKMRKDAPPPFPSNPTSPTWPGGVGVVGAPGFQIAGGAGNLGLVGGIGGGLGALGIGGMGALGIGGGMGALGIGGGALGIAGGVNPPVPLTPPLPAKPTPTKKDEKKDKPKPTVPPGASPGTSGTSAPVGDEPLPANRPAPSGPRRGREPRRTQ